MNPKNDKLLDRVRREVFLKKKAARESRTLLAQTVYLGTIGVMIALPTVAGAYLGQWLDSRLTGFSFSWTISLILIGVFVGAVNVYWLLKEGE